VENPRQKVSSYAIQILRSMVYGVVAGAVETAARTRLEIKTRHYRTEAEPPGDTGTYARAQKEFKCG
jgi:hypothetical protein